MTQRSTFNDDDDFEQFDRVNQPSIKQEASLINESQRTRKVFAEKTKQAISLPESELRLKINQHAVNYLAKREYSRIELHKKLTSSFDAYVSTNEDHHNALINHVLDDLAQHNWQSDQRYAEQISKVKGALFGVARLKQEFKQRGLSNELIQQELTALKNTELARATEVWLRKFGHAPTDLKEQAKQARFMASRGFGFDVVRQIIKGLE